ncbi:MAG: Glycerophosphoryl diester phosphodiesterase [Rhodospirillales bacterium]|nr:Glycerophosphoryl diester phosphodiesterase [Rhodospirillales bacterium]
MSKPHRSLSLGLLAATMIAGMAHASDPAPASDTTRAFDIEAHRGGRALRPENTLQSFANALSMGVDTLELDLGVTRDGVIVVSHERGLNPDLARDASGAYVPPPGVPFVKLNLAEVKNWDVGVIRPGSSYAGHFPDQLAVPGTKIPTLAEVFALVRRSGNAHVRLNIETKIDPSHADDTPSPEEFVSILLKLLQKERFADRVMVQSFDWRSLQLVHRWAPSIPTVYLTQQMGDAANVFRDKPSPWTAGFDPMRYGGSIPAAIKAAGGTIWSPFYRDIDAASVTEAHRLGVKVVAWTVNNPKDMADLIDMGIDGIISDRPDLLRRVAGKKGIALPQGTPVSP